MSKYKVTILYEGKRGCGYRTSGASGVGIYLMGSLFGETCERLAFPLTPCEECAKRGLKCQMTFSRAPTWIEPAKLFAPNISPQCIVNVPKAQWTGVGDGHHHKFCPMCSPWRWPERGLLIWIGRGHYSTSSFNREVAEVGHSHKLASIPRGFKVGEHWVFLAHPDAIVNFGEKSSAGIFRVFRPSRIDLVIDNENNIPKKAKRLKKKYKDKARLVKVVPEPEPEQLELEEDRT